MLLSGIAQSLNSFRFGTWKYFRMPSLVSLTKSFSDWCLLDVILTDRGCAIVLKLTIDYPRRYFIIIALGKHFAVESLNESYFMHMFGYKIGISVPVKGKLLFLLLGTVNFITPKM